MHQHFNNNNVSEIPLLPCKFSIMKYVSYLSISNLFVTVYFLSVLSGGVAFPGSDGTYLTNLLNLKMI